MACKKLWNVFIFILSAIPIYGQGEFTCTIAQSQIETGIPFEIVYTSTFGEIDQLTLPNVAGLSFSGRLGTSSSISIINGKQSVRYEYTYQAVAQQEGYINIPPARAKIGGKTYQCNQIKIKIKKPNRQNIPKNDDDVFFRAELTENKIYLGQQTTLTFDIYTSKNVINAEFQKKPAYPHLFLKNIDAGNSGRTISVGKKQYYTQTIAAFSVFAQKTGNHKIESSNIIYKYEKLDSANPFFNDIESKILATNSLDLRVSELPNFNVPPTFSGGVGDFSASCKIDKKTVTLNEPVRITLTIKGDGDPKFWGPPSWDTIRGIEFYDPDLINEATSFENGKEYTTRIYEYLLQPVESRLYRLYPKFSYFSPEEEKYKTWQSDPIEIQVLPGNVSTDQPLTHIAENALEPKPNQNSDRLPTLFILGIATLFIIILSFYLFKIKSKFTKNVSPPKNDQPIISPEEKLLLAKTLFNSNREKEFYQEILQVLSSGIAQAFALKDNPLNRSALISHLQEYHCPQDQIDSFSEIYSSCEMALYAGQKPDKEKIYNRCTDFIRFLSDFDKKNIGE